MACHFVVFQCEKVLKINFISFLLLLQKIKLCSTNDKFESHSAENGDLRAKTEALKKVIQIILNGEKMPNLLMTVIRFVMPLQDHTIKKLLLIFWEVVPKYTSDGKMLHEFILVCDAYRKV